jgi:nucleotide-binding universal stress UspA family protein
MTTTKTTPAAHRWLVAHDFSPSADAAARTAAKDLIERGQGGTITLLHVYQVMPLPTGFDGAVPGGGLVTLERAVAVETTRRLERAAEELRKDIASLSAARGEDAPDVEVEVAVRQDAPADGILAEAKERNVERITVGTHGRKGLSHLLLGSVAERVVRLAHVPVLVVKGA